MIKLGRDTGANPVQESEIPPKTVLFFLCVGMNNGFFYKGPVMQNVNPFLFGILTRTL